MIEKEDRGVGSDLPLRRALPVVGGAGRNEKTILGGPDRGRE